MEECRWGHLPGPSTEVPSSCLCQSVLGIRSPQVFHLVLDMLDVEKNTSVKKSVRHPSPPLPPASPTLFTPHALCRRGGEGNKPLDIVP